MPSRSQDASASHEHAPQSTKHDLSFFLHYHLHIRPLHSFPTRRSSDLAERDRLGHRGRLTQLRIVLLMPLLEIRLDRKSTRLNSSHQIISYAVFCLKKKNLICWRWSLRSSGRYSLRSSTEAVPM